jgi:hypothetical protein
LDENESLVQGIRAICFSSVALPVRECVVTIVRIGSTKKYSDGWETAFARKRQNSQKTATARKVTKKSKKR